MAQSKTIQSSEFDSLIIGGGLAGLIAAHQLEGTGRRVVLVEGLDALGGSCRPTPSKAGLLDHGLKIIPDTEDAREAIDWLGSIIGESIPFEVIDAQVQTYDEGKFKPFVGFGDQKVRTAHEIDRYAVGRYLSLQTTPKNWVPKLSEMFTGTLLTQSYVTRLQVDDEFVIEVLINGSKRISAREVLFAAEPQQLTRLLPETHVPVRLRQKLVKGEFWTSLSLDLVHAKPVTDSQAMHVLKSASEEPSVGHFLPPTTLESGATVQASQWMTFVPRDEGENEELVASALKQIKRQIKRAYEFSLEGLLQERIIVNPSSHGDLHGALPENGAWPKLQNLWAISGMFDTSKNLVGTLRQTRRTLATIAGEPAEPIHTDTDLTESSQPTA